MSADEIATGLSSFERRLHRRRMPDPPADLQARIMQAVSQELSNSSLPIHSGGDFLSFVAAMAAVLLIGLNLSLAAASETSLESRPKVTRQQTLAVAQTLRQLSPDLSESEAMRISILLQAGGDLTPLPRLQTSGSLDKDQSIGVNSERTTQ